ncbi:hypothetical protein HUK49_04970 [Limosilactobacillus sp. c11Ua_112_M]|uniref:hypothetical protein n=1 Tax=Limosilactobacillus TaxID=2742598 RepID=UPI00178079DA|nr:MULTISPECIES: hypothetical protein [Limosilactobacillus]MBD8087308.1 hypothetical protein [Limosilactobacillus portuensis]MEC4741788.1 hypothetical protein [Limosilactobacillus sp. c10Ua_36]
MLSNKEEKKRAIAKSRDEVLFSLDTLSSSIWNLQDQLTKLTGKAVSQERLMDFDMFTELEPYLGHKSVNVKEVNQVISKFLSSYSLWIIQMTKELRKYIKYSDSPSSKVLPIKDFLERTVLFINKSPETRDSSLSLGIYQSGAMYYVIIENLPVRETKIDNLVLSIHEDTSNFNDIQLGNSATLLKAKALNQLLRSISLYLETKAENSK